MKYRKMNKYEQKAEKARAVDAAMSGTGMYLYENSANATLTLPRPTASGLREVGPHAQFQGDNYYMQLVRSGNLRLIKTLMEPQVEQVMNEERLILDQPDTVTNKGKVEQVVNDVTAVQRLQEQDEEQPDVLLNEGPVDDGFVIVG
jgi:hypothetical protein